MAKETKKYRCRDCSREFQRDYGRCPRCKSLAYYWFFPSEEVEEVEEEIEEAAECSG